MAKKGQRIQDLLGLLNQLYDPALAEDWDNVGLQVGDPGAPLEKVLVALDPSEAAVAAAAATKAQALVTHHPLLFRAVKRLTPEDAVGQTVWTAIRANVAILCSHTNLDCAVDGLNSWLADAIGVQQSVPLQPVTGNYFKLIVFVPEGHEEQVADAVFSAGGGHVGAYDQCSFRSHGQGTFRPGQGTNPYAGAIGKKEQVQEVRLETIVPNRKLARVIEKMQKKHPYEEVAYDLIPLHNQVPGAGLGRIGTLGQETPLENFTAQVKDALKCDHLRVVDAGKNMIQKVALCGGSGAGLLQTAHRQGADVLVTGDAKYHDARLAEELGIALIDAGHFATEKIMIEQVVNALRFAAEKRHWDIIFEAYQGEEEPFRVY